MSRDEDELDIFQDFFLSKNIFTSIAIGTEGNVSNIVKTEHFLSCPRDFDKTANFCMSEIEKLFRKWCIVNLGAPSEADNVTGSIVLK